MGCGPKLPSCRPKAWAHDTLNQWEFKDSQEPWPNGFCVEMSLDVARDKGEFLVGHSPTRF